MSDIINQLNWRYATKQFDSTKKISEEDLNEVLEAMRLAPSSFGVQPWKFVVVTNPEVRQQLKAAGWGQSQISDASHLIVLCASKDFGEPVGDKLIQTTSEARNLPIENLDGYKNMVLGFLQSQTSETYLNWAQKQVYIALGFLLETCALKSIDACPMEGFDKAQFNEILKLDDLDLQATVICPIGYRSTEDYMATAAKVRYPKEEIFINID